MDYTSTVLRAYSWICSGITPCRLGNIVCFHGLNLAQLHAKKVSYLLYYLFDTEYKFLPLSFIIEYTKLCNISYVYKIDARLICFLSFFFFLNHELPWTFSDRENNVLWILWFEIDLKVAIFISNQEIFYITSDLDFEISWRKGLWNS